MAVREKKIIKKRIANAYLSSAISISLVLLLVGVAGVLLVNAKNVSDYFKENMKISVLFQPETLEPGALGYCHELELKPYVKELEFISRERGQKEMEAMLGKDFLTVFESSPIPLSVDLALKAEYVTEDSLQVVKKDILRSSLVDEVVYQKSLAQSLNSNINRISLVLGVFVALLLFISFVLINNVMRLSVYDKRFTIHTMKLVGATKSFIRAPFLRKSALLGLCSSFLALSALSGLLYAAKSEFTGLLEIFKPESLLVSMGIVLLSGVVICVVSAYFAVGKLLSLPKDDLY